jgi:hypothetical protein
MDNPLTETRKEKLLNTLTYYWQEKGRCDGFTKCEEALEAFPEIKMAWTNYKHAERVLDLVIKAANDER